MSVTGGLLRSSLLVFDVFPLADLSVSRLHLKLIPILVGVFCLAGWAEQPAAPEGAAVAFIGAHFGNGIFSGNGSMTNGSPKRLRSRSRSSCALASSGVGMRPSTIMRLARRMAA